jgi:hypothetical protein
MEHKRMTPNPSLHPTAYSGLRPLPSAGELKRWASRSAFSFSEMH